jgi:hypothetical protein
MLIKVILRSACSSGAQLILGGTLRPALSSGGVANLTNRTWFLLQHSESKSSIPFCRSCTSNMSDRTLLHVPVERVVRSPKLASAHDHMPHLMLYQMWRFVFSETHTNRRGMIEGVE